MPNDAYNIQNRNFGVELEIIGLTCAQAATAISNAGIECYAESYNHGVRSWWKTVTDASICPNGRYRNGCEIVSPILNGEAGIVALQTVCKALSNAGASVNTTTGLHVHVDARSLSIQELLMIVKRYADFETTIDSLVPNSRRAGNNRFCQSIVRVVNDSRFSCVRTTDELINLYRSIFRGDSRFGKLNVESYLRHGTIEFRQHSGSVNAEKVSNWVRFCVNFVSTSCSLVTSEFAVPSRRGGRRPAALTGPSRRGRRPAASNAKIVIRRELETSGLFNYVLPERLAEAAGISVASIPAVISSLRAEGMFIRNSRWYGYCLSTYGRTSRARTPRNAQPVVVEPTCFDGLSPALVSYYNERIQDLAA